MTDLNLFDTPTADVCMALGLHFPADGRLLELTESLLIDHTGYSIRPFVGLVGERRAMLVINSYRAAALLTLQANEEAHATVVAALAEQNKAAKV